MFDDFETERELAGYRLKLMALGDRYSAGARSLVAAESQDCADALICLMEKAPLSKRAKIDHLIDRYEALRINCSS
jgi:hypothetical protein